MIIVVINAKVDQHENKASRTKFAPKDMISVFMNNEVLDNNSEAKWLH